MVTGIHWGIVNDDEWQNICLQQIARYAQQTKWMNDIDVFIQLWMYFPSPQFGDLSPIEFGRCRGFKFLAKIIYELMAENER